MKQSKGRFELNKKGVKALLKSEECMKIAKEEAEKKGEIDTEYVGTQRVWVQGKEQ